MQRFSNPLTDYSPQLESVETEDETLAFTANGPFNEAEETALATELLQVSNERELEDFLGDLVRGVGKALGKVVGEPTARAIGGTLKSLVGKALPIAGSVVGGIYGGPLGAQLGGALGSVAGKSLGLELEGLSPEDREFHATKRFVRLAAITARRALLRQPLGTRAGEIAMHDIDRTQTEAQYELEGSESGEYAEEGGYDPEHEALVTELLELETEDEFEGFLGSLLQHAARSVGGSLSSPTGHSLGSLLKGAAGQLFQGGGQPRARGRQDAELEGEEYELTEAELEGQAREAAATFVKLAEDSGRLAAQAPQAAPPAAVASDALAQAAQTHAPRLLKSPSLGSRAPAVSFRAPARFPTGRRAGRWFRVGNQVVLIGL
jgi:hypothetical protein